MPAFPTLRTGAVAQYPLDRAAGFRTQTVQFLDGSSQRFPLQGAALRRWVVSLDLLDDVELGAVIEFVEQVESACFSFTDPVTGDSIAKCILAGDTFEASLQNEMTGQARLIIQEIL